MVSQTPFDRELIEHTRKINKTLSMFVFALQEGAKIANDSQLGIANLLDALAETIRARATEQPSPDKGGRIIDGNISLLSAPALGPGRGTGDGQ